MKKIIWPFQDVIISDTQNSLFWWDNKIFQFFANVSVEIFAP